MRGASPEMIQDGIAALDELGSIEYARTKANDIINMRIRALTDYPMVLQ